MVYLLNREKFLKKEFRLFKNRLARISKKFYVSASAGSDSAKPSVKPVKKLNTAELTAVFQELKEKQQLLEGKQIATMQEFTKLFSEIMVFAKFLKDTEFNANEVLTQEQISLLETTFNLLVTFLSENGEVVAETLQQLPTTLKGIENSFMMISKRLTEAAQAGDLAIVAVKQYFETNLEPPLEQVEDKLDLILQRLNDFMDNKNLLDKQQYVVPQASSLPSSSFPNEKRLIESLGIAPKKFNYLKEKVLPVLLKSRNGFELSEEEAIIKAECGPFELAILKNYLALQGAGTKFLEKQGNMIRVIFIFKDTSYLLSSENILGSQNDFVMHLPKQKSSLNNLVYKTELLYLVLKNDETVTTEELLDTFFERIFEKALSLLLPSTFLLESLQIQRVWPKQHKYSLEQRTYSAPGQLSAKNHESSLRPFSFILNPAFVLGSRNDFLIKFHGISKAFGNFHGVGVQVFNNSIKMLHKVLEEDFIIGKDRNVILQLNVKTKRSENNSPYHPVMSVSIGGFLPASNPQQKVVQSQPMVMEISQTESKEDKSFQ